MPPITPDDIFGVGDALLTAKNESHNRSAVSRFYYAAYHAAALWLEARPGMPSADGLPGGVHQQLLNKLNNGAPEWTADQKRQGIKIAATLLTLKTRRGVADYQLGNNLKPGEEQIQKYDAKRLIGLCAPAPGP